MKYLLRDLQIGDAESLAFQLNNKKVWDNLRDALPYPYTVQDARDFIEFQRSDSSLTCYAIEVEGNVVGMIGFVRLADVERYSAEVGYYIGENYWGRGIVTSALGEAVERYFNQTDVVRLFATPFSYNKASMRVLEKVGFSYKCVMTKAVYKNGVFVDMVYYEKVK